MAMGFTIIWLIVWILSDFPTNAENQRAWYVALGVCIVIDVFRILNRRLNGPDEF